MKWLRRFSFYALMESHISLINLFLVNNMSREYDDMKEEIKNLKNSSVHQRFSSVYKTMLS